MDPLKDLQGRFPAYNPLTEKTNKKETGKAQKKKGMSRSFRSSLEQAAESKEFRKLELSPQEVEEALEELLDDVHDRGDHLGKDPSWKNMQEYKKAVQKFVQVVISSSYEVEESPGILRKNFERKKYTRIQVINQKLDRLAASILQGQKETLTILQKVEELRGLLVDLKH